MQTGMAEAETQWRIQQAKNSKNRALIMQILRNYPDGLTTQQIISKEQEYYKFTFLTDNRLRELRTAKWIIKTDDNPAKWKISTEEEKTIL